MEGHFPFRGRRRRGGKMNTCEVERLKTKNHQEAIIQNICQDFNMSPIIARAYYQQMEKYFEEHLQARLKAGQTVYVATSKEEPAGKPIRDCLKKAVVLTLINGDDLELVEKKGLTACRQTRIQRMAEEARSQGAYLTCEDLAVLLTTSLSTIKRDLKELKGQGILVPLRGRMKDIGRVTSHKVKIVGLFLENYQFTEIEKITRHTEKSIERYLKDFTQVAILSHKNLLIDEIRQVAGFSRNLVKQYLDLYQDAQADPFKRRKLREILALSDSPVKKNPRGGRR